jgi:hypothetical protein
MRTLASGLTSAPTRQAARFGNKEYLRISAFGGFDAKQCGYGSVHLGEVEWSNIHSTKCLWMPLHEENSCHVRGLLGIVTMGSEKASRAG